MLKRISAAMAAMVALGAGSSLAWAEQPENWRIGFQEAATSSAREIQDFHVILMYVIVAITLFVTLLLAYVIWRFRAKRNPVPSKTSHHTLIEVLWTVVPVMILVLIAIPSFNLLYFLDRTADPELTIKATAQQFSWVYDYPDHEGLTLYSNMLPEEQLAEGQPYLLAVDEPLIVPVDTNVQLLITSQDVLHSFGMPSFGLKMDAVPGRMNETWFNADRLGVYYGQCSELCGANHAYMPIEIHVVPKEEFQQWISERQAALGIEAAPAQPTDVAALD